MIKPTLKEENRLWSSGFKYICGIDEVGRGSWAGPLVAAGVILPENFKLPDLLADSKLLTPNQRLKVSLVLKKESVAFSVSEVSPITIDRIGLTKATGLAFRKVIRSMEQVPDFCLIDAFYIKHYSQKKQLAIVHGDRLCASIAAASIIAKVHRDNLMKKLDLKFPNYNFGKHKGYGTKLHQEAIKNYGFLSIHRRSYHLEFINQAKA